jgi:hypothetical protein
MTVWTDFDRLFKLPSAKNGVLAAKKGSSGSD